MAKIIKFPKEPNKKSKEVSKEPSKNPEETKEKETIKSAQPLTQEDIEKLFTPLREGLKKLYPSQVEEVLGVLGMGEKNGDKVFMVGILHWKRFGVEHPYTSTFVAIFEKDKLEKISFLEAK